MTPICPYCGYDSVRVRGDVIYPGRPALHRMIFYLCRPCGAHVGCHPGTAKPLGRLANAELRRAKMAAHAAFDPIWRHRRISRAKAYKRLAEKLGIEQEKCHIGMMNLELCRKVLEVCKNW